ncbi:hypothetical protein TeGR_g4667 [Tetraparma gracilis]|uniref:Large ribosomal subunit protein mL43 n=1 Tax=Tetraparma gracilis TaxID=2962635 RepID=A0ABQ6MFY2_9STRA|nr:hypothetical protein TeGR_g4667 [Tetraparma gracilis]
MATHGQRQLLRLTISYCPHSGSSAHVRDFFASGQLLSFASANADLEIKSSVRRGKHPYIQGEYRTGWDKTIGIKNLPEKTILKNIHLLNDSSGRKITKITKNVHTEKPSVQGVWTPALDLIGEQWEIRECGGKAGEAAAEAAGEAASA